MFIIQQTPYRGSAPGPHWGTPVLQILYCVQLTVETDRRLRLVVTRSVRVEKVEITFDGVDVEKNLSNDDTGVNEYDCTQQRLNLVATQEFHNSLTSSAYKTPRNTTTSTILNAQVSRPVIPSCCSAVHLQL